MAHQLTPTEQRTEHSELVRKHDICALHYGTEHRLIIVHFTYIVIVPLNDLKEESWTILHVLGEDLQQIATFIIVHKDIQLLHI